MRVLYVITEIGKQSLSKPFTYLYDGHDQVDVRYRVMVPFGPREIMGFVTRVVETNKTKKELEEETGMPLRYMRPLSPITTWLPSSASSRPCSPNPLPRAAGL